MRNKLIAILMATTLSLCATTDPKLAKYGLTKGTPNIESFNEMTFGPNGILFVGDSKGAKIFAIATQDTIESEIKTGFLMKDIESRVADYLGQSKEDIMFHEMALNPISKNIYISISLKRKEWNMPSRNPDMIAYSDILLMIDINTKEITKVNLNNIFFSQYEVKDAPPKESIMYNINQRTITFTDMKFRDNELLLAGKSGENFTPIFKSLDFPFTKKAKTTKIEYFYYGHDRYVSWFPASAFDTYTVDGNSKLLAVFYGNPLITFNLNEFSGSETDTIRGKNISELWGGHSKAVDMIQYNYKNIDYVLISLSNRGLAEFRLDDIKAFQGDLIAKRKQLKNEVEIRREYASSSEVGVHYKIFAGPVQEMENYSTDHFMALQRMENGNMDLGLRRKQYLSMFAEPQGIKEYIEHYINRKSIVSGIDELESVMKNRRTEYTINERELNGLSYSILSKSKKDAIEVFKIYVQTYPESANAYDSYAESYMLNGDIKNAIINYEKSLELNPANDNAKEMLKKLKK